MESLDKLIELFRTDDRPTFIVDSLPEARCGAPLVDQGLVVIHQALVRDAASGALQACNSAFVRLAGRAGVDLDGGARIGVAVVTEHRGLLQRQFARLRTGQACGPVEVRVRPAEGDEAWLVVAGKKMAGDAVGLSLSEVPARLAEQAERADMAMHELKNTLAAVLHAADTIHAEVRRLAATHGPVAALADACSTIRLCAEQQRRITADALTLSLLGAHALELRLHEAAPAALLDQLPRLFAPETAAGGVELRTRVQGQAPGRLLLDAGRLLQVLVNLTANAIKATPRGGHVTVALQMQTGSARPPLTPRHGVRYRVPAGPVAKPAAGEQPVFLLFSVEDTGPGLAPETVQRLFDRFGQPGAQGYGLGLHIARRLTELHHGQICVSSAPGHGSTFDFYVRALQPCAPRPAAVPVLPPPGLLHCLVVDDNYVVRRVLAQQLRELGVRVSLAEDGRQALMLLKKTDVSAVLLDLDMPVMDGLTCVKHIRQMERGNRLRDRTPVIGVTGFSNAHRALEAGMDSVLTKPFRVAEVLPHLTAVAAKVRMGIKRLCE
ncbi:Sensor histidine kinase AruS [Lasiodiplodia theobromae]|uniref:Sensor histidine kinase AruS n=1 Tax=Lasiodiplodia theobromae TaxID=45133 RepID=A0A5N5CY04_9PEZI|nr:Sensor histidine kinase AruS [Lasiodiplodia theobromae]